LNEQTRKTGQCPKEVAAQLRTSIANVATLPKNVNMATDADDR
jgi:transcriptional regulator